MRVLKGTALKLMKNDKHFPQRTCIVCGSKMRKCDLVRLVFNDRLYMDEKQTEEGRGRYVCKHINCIRQSADGKVLRRAFRLRVISNAEIAELIERLSLLAV